MLVVAMKKDGILKIGDDIHVYVSHVGGGQVRLSIRAPLELAIEHLPPDVPVEASEPEVIQRTRAWRR